MRTATGIWLVIGLTAVVGCGSGPRTMRMWGQVSYDGKPVEEGTIVLTPIDDTPGPSTGGPIENGFYDILAEGGPLAEGTYRVEITALAPTGQTGIFESNQGPSVELFDSYIPAVYNRETALKVTISKKSSENENNFHLKKTAAPVQP